MISKPWNWVGVDDKVWLTPSSEFYYLRDRWKALGLTNVLDLGCGKGRHAVAFAKADFNVSACDLSQVAVDITKENAKAQGLKIDVVSADILDLPYADASFDVLFSYHVISHTDTDGLKRAVSEIERVVRTGGEIFVDLVSKESLLFKRANKFIDKNTFIMEEIEAERGLPHCCVDYSDIAEFFKNFEFLSVQLRFSYNVATAERYGGHYFIHAVKK